MKAHATRPPSPDDAFAGAAPANGFAPAPTYFDQPVLKAPHWGWNVVTYLFLGGIMGGSAIVAALAHGKSSDADRKLAENANVTSLVLAAVCPMVLISHLGRPERFLHMLRIVKFKSPMSLGVWGLVLFSGAAAAGVVRDASIRGIIPRALRHIAPPGTHLALAALGAFIAGYTGVLISATAVPLWAKGKWHIPAISVASGLAGGCALQSLLLARTGSMASHKVEKLELAAASLELLLLLDFKRHAGAYGTPMYKGERGARLSALTLGLGLAFPIALTSLRLIVRPSGGAARTLTVISSACTLFGGYILRDTLIEAGKDSADDPHAAFAQPE